MESTVSAEAYVDLRLHVNGTVQARRAWNRNSAITHDTCTSSFRDLLLFTG